MTVWVPRRGLPTASRATRTSARAHSRCHTHIVEPLPRARMRQALRHASVLAGSRHSTTRSQLQRAASAAPDARPCSHRGACAASSSGSAARPWSGVSAPVATQLPRPAGHTALAPRTGRRRAASACGAAFNVQQPLCERAAAYEARFAERPALSAFFYWGHVSRQRLHHLVPRKPSRPPAGINL